MTGNPEHLYCAGKTWNFLNRFAILRKGKLEQNLKLGETTAKMDIRAKVLGGMIGSAVGDAIGELAFSYPQKDILSGAVMQETKLRYTDDTAMAIGLAESLIEQDGTIDQQKLGETFHKNFEQEPWRGYGMGPPAVFSMVEELNIIYSEAARRLFGGKGSFGNGAAMRIAPVGLFFFQDENFYERVCASSGVTHTHPLGMDGAALQARAVALATSLDPGEDFPVNAFLKGLMDFARTPEIQEKLTLLEDLIKENASPDVAARKLGQTVAAHESVPFAVYSFVRHPNSFEECLDCAVLNGGDRDTMGAMACAVSGAYLGVDRIPPSWIDKLENREYIEGLASRLFDKMKGIK
jgi:poly(ADP-ribose) glycohydrolase ARH3